uniref:Uncharacterized protein n=1 Tax=Oryza glumipatula TaxID=40148 RepID=A0A0E0AD67_9ORYZ
MCLCTGERVDQHQRCAVVEAVESRMSGGLDSRRMQGKALTSGHPAVIVAAFPKPAAVIPVVVGNGSGLPEVAGHGSVLPMEAGDGSGLPAAASHGSSLPAVVGHKSGLPAGEEEREREKCGRRRMISVGGAAWREPLYFRGVGYFRVRVT